MDSASAHAILDFPARSMPSITIPAKDPTFKENRTSCSSYYGTPDVHYIISAKKNKFNRIAARRN